MFSYLPSDAPGSHAKTSFSGVATVSAAEDAADELEEELLEQPTRPAAARLDATPALPIKNCLRLIDFLIFIPFYNQSHKGYCVASIVPHLLID
jgi:hypothetical protein